MKIFFTGSIRGGREQQPNFKVITDILEKHGDLLSDHVAHPDISHFGETDLSAQEILEREKESILESDVVVAEVTRPSLGVGYFISFASFHNKKIIALYEGENTLKLSAIIKGDKNVTIETYTNITEIESILEKNLVS